MKNLYIYLFVFVSFIYSFHVNAQGNEGQFYRRNSVYSLLVSHQEQDFSKEIMQQFFEIPVPDKFNDHNLSIRCANVFSNDDYGKTIDDFIEENFIASRLVGKWFNRNVLTGECDMNLIKERGIYDANAFDIELAKRSIRGVALLQDAGEDLIGNTFLIVNEIKYVDKNKTARIVGGIVAVLGSLAGSVTGTTSYGDLGNDLNSLISTLKGFSVKINTRLYQLDWNDSVATIFYKNYYSDVPNEGKRAAFEQNRGLFKMKYIGDVESKGGVTSFLGIKEDEPYLMIRKACQRAIDENVADLQKKYVQFRVKAPILSVQPTITAQIGLKEGVTPDSKFEVLEVIDNNGKIEYKRVGVVKAVINKIWDNRFMASEEGAFGADLGFTTFVKVSGGDFYPGMLIREI